jgi:spore maturation protein SpmA
MLNFIWLGLIVVGVFVAGLLGRITGDGSVTESAFAMGKQAITLALGLVGGMMLWLGMLRLAEKAGLMRAIARAIQPVMKLLFPDVPKDHPAMGAMVMNMAANMLGLGNAATPLGLKAMQELNTLNPHPGTATNSMAMFLAINTASITLIPASSLIYVSAAGVPNPHAILIPSILATACAATVAVTLARILQGLPAFRVRSEAYASATASTPAKEASDPVPADPPVPRWGWILMAVAGLMLLTVIVFEIHPTLRSNFLASSGIQQLLDQNAEMKSAAAALKEKASALEKSQANLKPEGWRGILNSISALVIPCVLVLFVVIAAAKGVRVYEEFVQGAKEGWDTAVRIMPYLVAIFVAMGMFRESGALTLLQWAVTPLLNLLHFPPDLLPLALMRPLSGSGSLGLMAELLSRPDLPLQLKYTAATMFGSTETTFYVLAVYFGSVAVRNGRHAIVAGLCADLTGLLASVVICRMLFP